MPIISFPPSLGEGNVRLRAVTPDDWRLEQALSRDDAVTRWTTIPENLDDEAARTRVGRAARRFADGTMALWIIERDGAPCGSAGLAPTTSDSAEIFYVVAPSMRGNGIATTAARLLLAWARDAGSTTVSLATFPDNTASQRVAQRAGFSRAGTVDRTIKGRQQMLLLWRVRADARSD